MADLIVSVPCSWGSRRSSGRRWCGRGRAERCGRGPAERRCGDARVCRARPRRDPFSGSSPCPGGVRSAVPRQRGRETW